MAALINRNLKEHRGAPRIYLDDSLLDQLNVSEESPFYDREWHDDKLVLRMSENGKYKVSSKAKNGARVNVIDINTSQLAKVFDENAKLRIAIKEGLVVIQTHSSDIDIKQREEDFIHAIQTGQTLTTCSLFHGGGVMDNALHSGFARSKIASTVKFVVEMDERYLNSSIKNNSHLFNPDTIYINSDVADVHTASMPKVNLLYAGIPCTGASVAGRAKNKLQFAESHESSGACFFSFLNIVKAAQPAIVQIENVKQYINTASYAIISSVLGNLGYDLLTNVYNGLDYGASESRERMVCVAVSKGLNTLGMLDLIDEKMEACKTPLTPLSEIIENIPSDSPRWKEVTYLKEKEKKDKAAGKGFAMQILTNESLSCGTIGAGYAKARSTEPRLQHPTNPELSRLFTPVEHALIKKAPISIIAGLSDTVAHQVMGNGVSWKLFDELGSSIAEAAKECLVNHNKQIAA